MFLWLTPQSFCARVDLRPLFSVSGLGDHVLSVGVLFTQVQEFWRPQLAQLQRKQGQTGTKRWKVEAVGEGVQQSGGGKHRMKIKTLT